MLLGICGGEVAVPVSRVWEGWEVAGLCHVPACCQHCICAFGLQDWIEEEPHDCLAYGVLQVLQELR